MWEVDYKEYWEPKNWCFRIVMLEKTLESPLDSKIKPANPKGNQLWIFFGRTDAEAETPIFSHLMQIHWNANEFNGKPIHWERPWCWERSKAGEKGDDTGWDGPTQWTWVWANSGRWWRTGKPAWRADVHGVAKSQTQLSDWTTTVGGVCVCVCVRARSHTQSCLTLCNLVHYSLLGSSVHAIFQARIHSLLQGIFLTQGSNLSLLCLLHWQADSLSLCHLGSLPSRFSLVKIFKIFLLLPVVLLY